MIVFIAFGLMLLVFFERQKFFYFFMNFSKINRIFAFSKLLQLGII